MHPRKISFSPRRHLAEYGVHSSAQVPIGSTPAASAGHPALEAPINELDLEMYPAGVTDSAAERHSEVLELRGEAPRTGFLNAIRLKLD